MSDGQPEVAPTESSDDGDADKLVSPPHGWPASATMASGYVSKVLRGTRTRLVNSASAEHQALLAGIELVPGDSRANALRVRAHLGWSIIGGFALYERADSSPEATGSDRYFGREHYWNANARGLWVDLTPRHVRHSQLVLIESTLSKPPPPTASAASPGPAAPAASPGPTHWCSTSATHCMWCRRARCASSTPWAGNRAPAKPVIRLFALEVHQSVIADVSDMLAHIFGGAVSIDTWMVTTRAFLFGKEEAKDVRHITASTWHQLSPERIAAFRRDYAETLAKYDGFVVTHTLALALIYEPLRKPIVAVNTCRYDQPMCWTRDVAFFEMLNERLSAMHARDQLHVVSNNKADAAYLRLGSGIKSPCIPSLCTYTNVAYTGRRREWVLMGTDVVPPSARGRLLTMSEAFGEGRLKYEWAELYDMAGVVLLPYEVSTMTLFELYSANVPILVPDAALLRKLDCVASVAHYGGGASYVQRRGSSSSRGARALASAAHVDFFINRADFYDSVPGAMPHIHTFSAVEELGDVISSIDTTKTSAAMAQANRTRTSRVRSAWRCLMLAAFPALRADAPT